MTVPLTPGGAAPAKKKQPQQPQLKQKSIHSFFAPRSQSKAAVVAHQDVLAESSTPLSTVNGAAPCAADTPIVIDADGCAVSSSSMKRQAGIDNGSDDENAASLSNQPRLNKARRIVCDDDDDDDDADTNDGTSRPVEAMQVDAVAPKTPAVNKVANEFATPSSAPSALARQRLSMFAQTPGTLSKQPAMAPPQSSPMLGTTPLLITGDERRKERKANFNVKNEAKYTFLNDIKDADGRRPDDPDYDPRTLYIPPRFWNEATPVEKQYWAIKCKHFDSLVFFKKGKFYELFERDADIGQREFDLKLTDRAHMRMVGVPEASFEFWVSKFIARGYKVAKVDQLETALGKEMRERDGPKVPKKDDIIRRELTAVLTSGTLVDGAMLTSDMSTYCLALKELVSGGKLTFGVAFVDTATAEFNVCQIEDEEDRAQLETLIMQVKPKEVIYEKGMLSSLTMRLLKNSLSNANAVMWNAITPGREFWDYDTTLFELKASKYFSEECDDGQVPTPLHCIADKPLAVSSLGALVWYLKSLKLDQQLLSSCEINYYDPIRNGETLIMDGQTLINLEIFQNTLDGGNRGTLHHLLNHCLTPFGKRLFKKWMCHPAKDLAVINNRLDAVEDLNSCAVASDALKAVLSRLPDFERLNSRIHSGSCRLKDFLVVLAGYEKLCSALREFSAATVSFKSKRLKQLCGNLFPLDTIESTVLTIKQSFNVQTANSTGEFIVNKGVEQDYDEINERIVNVEKQFAEYLAEQKREWGCAELKYRDLGKEIYQLEFPAKLAHRLPAEWQRRSSTKAVVRVHSPHLQSLVRQYQEAKELRQKLLGVLFTRTLAKFDAAPNRCWTRAVMCVAELDCLLSLAAVSGDSGVLGVTKCRPEFIADSERAVFEVADLRHPCIITSPGSSFIPNDIALGGEAAPMILLTGPNMGGKSTLLRQTCVAIIMAQLGCYVPASRCQLSLFDRIFTRIGANDNILAGQSTFMVELSETSKILQQATTHSLVILDELGRGTSTFDGYAIAYSVLAHLAERVKCVGLFSTHYGLLTSEFSAPLCPTPSVRCMHMSCCLDDDNKSVTFLYKLVDGVSAGSYGTHVARMAGVPEEILANAVAKSEEMVKEKGWIGCVGLRSDGVEGEYTGKVPMSSSLMVQRDFKALCQLMSSLKVQKNEATKSGMNFFSSALKTARARYL